MYIEKKNIGGLKYCEGCPYFKLKMDKFLYTDNRIIVTCEHHDICYRINLIVCEEDSTNVTKKKGE